MTIAAKDICKLEVKGLFMLVWWHGIGRSSLVLCFSHQFWKLYMNLYIYGGYDPPLLLTTFVAPYSVYRTLMQESVHFDATLWCYDSPWHELLPFLCHVPLIDPAFLMTTCPYHPTLPRPPPPSNQASAESLPTIRLLHVHFIRSVCKAAWDQGKSLLMGSSVRNTNCVDKKGS